mmetsp:Transcript_61918/g.102905  ORF Transcript_61918/g.102905 Transcript_61918/m.102905 type:complete len:209 (+) Transcript_61918:34-660(+)
MMTLAAFTLGLSLAPHASLQRAGPACVSSRFVTMSETNNPLARFFGKNQEKSGGSELVSGVDALLRDAPLPVKVLGGLMKPLIKGMGDMIAESAGDAEALLDVSIRELRLSPQVTAELGRNLQSGGVFSTGSSSSNINGRTQKRIQLGFAVIGSGGQRGMASVVGTANDGSAVRIQQLQLQVNGRTIDVSSQGTGGTRDGVIDVEAVG